MTVLSLILQRFSRTNNKHITDDSQLLPSHKQNNNDITNTSKMAMRSPTDSAIPTGHFSGLTLGKEEDTRPLPRPFHCIGYGHCGSVWSVATSDINTSCSVIKREDMAESRSVLNDSIMHRKFLSALELLKLHSPATAALTSTILVPTFRRYVQGDDITWWNMRLG